MSLQANTDFVTFRVNSRLFAINSLNINSIIQAQKPEPIPEYPPYILGTITHEDKILPIIDSRRRFGYPPAEITKRNCIIIIHDDGKTVGILIDEILNFISVTTNKIQPAPQLNEDASSPYIDGSFILDNEVCYIISPVKMITLRDLHLLGNN